MPNPKRSLLLLCSVVPGMRSASVDRRREKYERDRLSIKTQRKDHRGAPATDHEEAESLQHRRAHQICHSGRIDLGRELIEPGHRALERRNPFRVGFSIRAFPVVGRKQRGRPRALRCSRVAAVPTSFPCRYSPVRIAALRRRRYVPKPGAQIYLNQAAPVTLRDYSFMPSLRRRRRVPKPGAQIYLNQPASVTLQDYSFMPALRRRRYVPEPGVGCAFCILPRVERHAHAYPNGVAHPILP
jgi:hypothetical protein